MAGERSGSDVVALVDVDKSESTNYKAVGSQSGLSREETRDILETSNKNNDAKQHIYGKYGSTVTLDSFFVPDGASFQILKDAVRNALPVKLRVRDDNGDIEEADALVSSYSEDWPDNEAATISIEFTIDGSWSKV